VRSIPSSRSAGRSGKAAGSVAAKTDCTKWRLVDMAGLRGERAFVRARLPPGGGKVNSPAGTGRQTPQPRSSRRQTTESRTTGVVHRPGPAPEWRATRGDPRLPRSAGAPTEAERTDTDRRTSWG